MCLSSTNLLLVPKQRTEGQVRIGVGGVYLARRAKANGRGLVWGGATGFLQYLPLKHPRIGLVLLICLFVCV